MNFCSEERALQWLSGGYAVFFSIENGIFTEDDTAAFKKAFKKNDIAAYKESKNKRNYISIAVTDKVILINNQGHVTWLYRPETRWFYVQTIRAAGLCAWIPKLGRVYVFTKRRKPSKATIDRCRERAERYQNEISSWGLRVLKKTKRQGIGKRHKKRRGSRRMY